MDEKSMLVTQYNAQIGEYTGLLTNPVSPYGDWKQIKQNEYIAQGKDAPYTEEEMKAYYDKRAELRAGINEYQKKIEELG